MPTPMQALETESSRGGAEPEAKWKGVICLSLLVAIIALIIAIMGVQDEITDATGKNTAKINDLDQAYTAADAKLKVEMAALKQDVDEGKTVSDDLKEKIENGDIVTGVTKTEMQQADTEVLSKVDEKVAVVGDKLNALKAGSLSTRAIHLAMITHGHSDDPFWSELVKPGFEQAVSDMHVHGQYLNPDDDTKFEDYDHMGKFLESSAYRMLDGIATTIPNVGHPGLKKGIETALDEPVPVISFNSGLTGYDTLKADTRYIRTHVGQDETIAGFEAGRKMASYGAENVRCIEHAKENTAMQERCKNFCAGVKQRGGSDTKCESSVHLWDKENVEEDIKALLEGDWDAVDGIMALGPSTSDHIAKALELAGKTGDVTFATFDHSDTVLKNIEKGTMAFAVDQAPYSQGYLPIVALALNAEIGTMLGATGSGPGAPVYSGPSFITPAIASKKIGQNFKDMSTAAKQRKDMYISFVSHGHGSRSLFWSTVMKGARQAGLDLGIGRVEFHHPARKSGYTQSYDLATFKEMFNQQVAQGADGLAISVTDPDVAAYMESVCTSGKPCVSINSGMWDGLAKGAFTHMGMEEFTAGAMAGKKLADDGYTKLYCIMHDDSNIGIVDRCAGATKMFNCKDDNSLAYDSHDAERPIKCTTNRSTLTSETVEILESKEACNNQPGEWKCTDTTPGVGEQNASLNCGINGVQCCQCKDGQGDKIVFTPEQIAPALKAWYAGANVDDKTAIMVVGGDMDKNLLDAVGDKKPKTAVFDCSHRALNNIIMGNIEFCVDQQPFLQGYLPVVYLANAIQWGEQAGGGKPSYTGPAIVTSAEASQVLLYAEQGYR